MMNTIPNITEDQSNALGNIISQIVKETKPEKIICFGARTNHNFIWSGFLDTTDEIQSIECDLVIVTQEREKEKRDELSNNVTKLNTAALKFTVLVHGSEAVNDELRKGNYFFSSLYNKGVILYDSQITPLSSPRLIAQSVSDLEPYWKNRYYLANNFLKGAAHALSQGWNGQAVFMLHQAVEHTCITLIRVYMGYKATTHKLSKLLSMVENFSLYCVTVFPRITKDEIRLFNILEKAYSDSRYDEKFTVSTETANALKAEVEDFLEIAQALFLRKVQASSTGMERLEVSPFESIALDTFARVVLKKGDRESVEVESNYGSVKSIQVKNEDKRLWISTIDLELDKVYDATVYITYKKLSGLVVHHAESVTSNEPIEAEWLGIINNSPGTIDLHVDAAMLDVTLNKHGNIILSGSAGEAKLFNHRTGNIDGKDLAVTSAKVIIKGAGNVYAHIEDELQAELHGSGSLIVTGSPRIKTMTATGAGTVKITN